MRTVLQNVRNGVISVEDVPPPISRPGFVLVDNACSLVSAGTEKAVLDFSKSSYLEKARQRPDLVRKVLSRAQNEGVWQTYKVVQNLIDQPIQLGYSCAGFVRELGPGVDDIAPGQRVACAGLFYATHSEVVAVPRNLTVPLPAGLTFEQGAFVTLGAIAMQGVRLARLEVGESVVVYGLGLVGMLAAEIALAAGCRVIGVDLDAGKVERLRSRGGIGVAAGPEMVARILAETGGAGADKVILCAATKSNEPVERVPEFTRLQGSLVIVGDVSMNLPRRPYFEKEIDVRVSRSYGPGRYDPTYEEGGLDYPYAYVRWTENRNMASFLDLVGRGRVDVSSLVTHRLPIASAAEAYELIEGKRKEPYLGIVIRYREDRPTAPPPASVVYGEAPRKAPGDVVLGVIGAGQFAKALLLPALTARKGVRIAAVCTASGASAAAVAKRYSAETATSDPEHVFTAAHVDAVVIATRHDSHARYVRRALECGKAVFVEKPLATTIEDLDRIRDLVASAQGRPPVLMVGFNRRFSPLAVALKGLLVSSREPISVVYRVNAGFVPPETWVHDPVAGGGRLVGEGGHFVDFISFLCGESPTAVSVAAVRRGGAVVPDIVTVTLEFPGGSLGTVHYFANGHPSMPKEHCEVFQAGRCATLWNFRRLEVHGAGVQGRTRYLNQVKGFDEEAEAFVRAVREGGPGPVPFAELYATHKATLIADEMVRRGMFGRAPLDLG